MPYRFVLLNSAVKKLKYQVNATYKAFSGYKDDFKGIYQSTLQPKKP